MPTVLVVDDEPNIVTLLETWLETIGCDVVSAGDGERAVEKARDLQPDLILMDQMMPRMTGFDACIALKSDPRTEDIPLIFLTVQGELQDVIKGLELGAHGYMTKPFKPQELLARVRSLLKLKQVHDRLKSHAQPGAETYWMGAALQNLPLPMLVFELESGRIAFSNLRWRSEFGELELARPIWEQLSLEGELNEQALRQVDPTEGDAHLSRGEQALGRFRLSLSTFRSEGQEFRQVVLQTP